VQTKIPRLKGNLLLKIDLDYNINIRDCVVDMATPYGLEGSGIETH